MDPTRKDANMSNFLKEWGGEYNTCIVPLQGKNSKLAEHAAVVKGTLPLEKSLATIDKLDPSTMKAGSDRDSTCKALEKELKVYNGEVAKYKKVITAALAVTPKTSKEAYRALKKLDAHLAAVTAKVAHLAASESAEGKKKGEKAGERVEKETAAGRKKGMTDDELKKATDYAKQLKSLSQFPTAVETAYTKAKMTVQVIKSDPTVATYNKEMDAGGRNYTQQVGNLIKLSKDSKCPSDVQKLLKGIEKFKGGLDAYGNGDRRKLPDKTSSQDVLTYLKGFAKLVKETYPYAESMKAYLKKHALK